MPDDTPTPPAPPADGTAAAATPPAGAPPPAGAAASPVVIPDEIKTKFGDLVDLILGSESMNDEERQYWVNILPIMTPEQVQNLREILENEKRQLAAIDAKYSKEVDRAGQQQFIQKVGEERRERIQQRSTQEESSRQAETQAAEDLLKQIDGI